MRAVIAVVMFLIMIIPATATTYIRNSPGGLISDFVRQYEGLHESGDNVVISGYCLSACTLVTGFVAQDKACVMSGTWFGFHSAYYKTPDQYDRGATRAMWNVFPEWVRRLVRSRGWNGISRHPNLVRIKGTDIYPAC